jgi:FMN-dependent NADH-azoreductase
MTLFRLDASMRVEGSFSRAFADIVENEWRVTHTDQSIVRRDLGIKPLPATAWAAAASAGFTPADKLTDEQKAATALATELADELINADALVFAVPLYNFGVSAYFKTWVDLVVTDPRMGPGGPRPLAGKPAVLVTVRGGGYGAGTPREGWDHSTDYLRRILAEVWGADLTVVEREFTLVGVNPALDEFTDLAKEMHQGALSAADEAGRVFASADEVARAS